MDVIHLLLPFQSPKYFQNISYTLQSHLFQFLFFFLEKILSDVSSGLNAKYRKNPIYEDIYALGLKNSKG